MLEVKSLSKTYISGIFTKNTHIGLSNISFSLKSGDVLGISGSGKSTLAQCILRLIELTSDTIIINGSNISRLKQNELNKLRPKMQMIF